MRKWVDELFITIMDMLQDSSLLAKRQVRTASSGLGRTSPWGQGPCLSSSLSAPSQCLSQSSAHSKYSEISVEENEERSGARISSHPDLDSLSVILRAAGQWPFLWVKENPGHLSEPQPQEGKRKHGPVAVEASRASAYPSPALASFSLVTEVSIWLDQN